MECPKCKRAIPDDANLCCYCGKRIGPVERKARKRPNKTGSVYKNTGHREKPWVATRSGTYIGSYSTRAEALEALEHTSWKTLTEMYNMSVSEIRDIWKVEQYRKVGAKAIEAYDNAWV